jgi:acylphosphatase
VVAIAEGPRERIEEFVELCRRGPPSAKVDDVQVSWSPAEGTFRTFMVAR